MGDFHLRRLGMVMEPEAVAAAIARGIPHLTRASKIAREKVLGIGVALSGHVNHAKGMCLHSNLLGLQVQRGDWISVGTVRDLTAGLAAKSNGLAGAAGRALGIVDGKVRLQAYALTFIDAFHLVVWTCVGVLFVIAMLHRSPMNFRDLGSLQGSAPTGEAKP